MTHSLRWVKSRSIGSRLFFVFRRNMTKATIDITDLSSNELGELLIQAEDAIAEERKELARKHHLEFMKYCWRKGPEDPFIVGFHTERMIIGENAVLSSWKSNTSKVM